MKRSVATTALAVACGFALAVNAQGQAGQAEDREVTMTGCLQAGDEPRMFVLTNIEDATPREVVGTTGVDEAEKVHLTPAPDVDMQAHVGHKVEITGPVTEPEREAEPQVRVTSFRHVAATCP